MSVISEQASSFELASEVFGSEAELRHAHRFTGFLIATSASVLLWGGIGTGIWGLVSLFG